MSRINTEVLQLKASLEKAVSSDELSEQVLDVFNALAGVQMTPDILASTKIAIAVNDAKKKLSESDKAYAVAKDLMKKWKKIYEAAAKSESKTVGKSEGKADAKGEAKSEDRFKDEAVKSVSKEESKAAPRSVAHSKSEDADEEIDFDVLPSVRRNALELFKAQLKLNVDNESVAGSLAFHIESSIDALIPYNSDAKAYTAKVRSLASNLKRNERLRVDIVEGALAPQNLVHLTPNELATDEQRAEREKSTKSDMEARRTDYYQINRANIMLANGLNPNAGGEFTCRRCKGTKTTHYALQTRSADEPMTIFVTCLTCGKRWRTN